MCRPQAPSDDFSNTLPFHQNAPAMLRLASLLLVLLPPLLGRAPLAAAQERIETDRDSFTPATVVTARQRLVLEAAHSFVDNRGVPETHSFPELLVRYGLTEGLELRLGSNYEVGGESSSITGGDGGGEALSPELETEANVSFGVKTALTEQDGLLPRSVAILQATTPTSGPETATHGVVTYAWGWELAERWQWDSAIRYSDGAVEEDDFNRWAQSTVLKVGLAQRWNGHLECFGIYSDGQAEETSQTYVSPGLHFLATPDLEIGVRTGWGVSHDAALFFSNVGVGLQF